ncbi:MAG: MipA/OmpV family protein [Acidobacteriota bacterium]
MTCVYTLKKDRPRPPRFSLARPLCFAAALVLSTSGAWADDSAPAAAGSPAPGDSGGFFVAGVATLPEYEGADDGRLVPFVVSRFRLAGASVELEGLTARADVASARAWRAGPVISLILPRDEDFVDQAVVQSLEEVDLAVQVGLFVGFEIPLGPSVEDRLRGDLTISRDVAGAHDGLVVQAEVDYFRKISRMLRLGLAASLTWADGSYHRTYFSIDPEDSGRSGLAVFEAGAGLKDAGLELYAITSFSERWGVFTRVAYSRLLEDAADSPLVAGLGSRDQVFAGAGAFYRW